MQGRRITISIGSAWILIACAMFVSPAAADICTASGTSCSSCIAQSGCGWNGASCYLGSGSGPTNPANAGTRWDYFSCPCNSALNCQDCTQLVSCGWDGSTCRLGTSAGPTYGATTGTWYYGGCISFGSAAGIAIGVIVGAVVGVLLFWIVVCACCCYWCSRPAQTVVIEQQYAYAPMVVNAGPGVVVTETVQPAPVCAPVQLM